MVIVSDDSMNQQLQAVVTCPLTTRSHPGWRSRLQVKCEGRAAEIAVDQIRALSKIRQLGIGPLRVETEGETHLLMIDGGLAQMVDNKLTILTERATRATEIDREAARQALEEAMARVAHTAEEHAARREDIERARTLVKLAPVER